MENGLMSRFAPENSLKPANINRSFQQSACFINILEGFLTQTLDFS